MTAVLVGFVALIVGYAVGIAHAAYMDTHMHCRDQRAADDAWTAARAEYARRDAHCAAVGDWMAESYRSAGGIAKNAFPDYAATAPKTVEYEPWVVQP